jgi:hypothetical protein
MIPTTQEKAKAFVRAVSDLHETLKRNDRTGMAYTVTTLTAANENISRLLEHMLAKQREFKSSRRCGVVDIGFHYTSAANLRTIRTCGLLTLKERAQKNIISRHNGSSNGDGIYTCDNHTAYRSSSYGTVCLLVARLKGATTNAIVPDVTYVCNSVVVLRSSAQCVPLIHFEVAQGTAALDDLIFQYQRAIRSLIDSHFNYL